MPDVVPVAVRRANGQAWRVLMAATVAQVSVSIVAQGIPTLAPFIQTDLGLTRGQVGLFASMVNLGFLFSVNSAGWAVDSIGEKQVLIFGLVTVLLMGTAVASSSGFLLTVLGLLIVGAGSATITPAGSKVVMNEFPPDQRGLAMGVRQTGIPIGGGIAAAILPLLAAASGWRTALIGATLICMVGGGITALLLRRSHRSPLPAAPTQPPVRSPVGAPLRSLLTREVTLVCLGCLFMAPSQFVLITYLALFLREELGLPIAVGTLVLSVCQLAGALSRIGVGMVSDRLFRGRRSPVLALLGAAGGGAAAALALLPDHAPTALAVVLGIAFGIVSLSWHGLHITLASELAGPGRQGRTVALTMTALFTGIVGGPPVFGFIVDLTSSYRVAWAVVAGAMCLGALFFALVREGRSPAPAGA